MKPYEHRAVQSRDFEIIATFPQNRNELFFMYPKGIYPLTAQQLEEAAMTRTHPIVVTRGQQVAGYCNLYDVTQEDCWLGNVIVAPAFRGGGAGGYMIRTMMDYAREELQVAKFRLVCHNTNTAALLFYTKLGFTPFGIKTLNGPDGQEIAGIKMEQSL